MDADAQSSSRVVPGLSALGAYPAVFAQLVRTPHDDHPIAIGCVHGMRIVNLLHEAHECLPFQARRIWQQRRWGSSADIESQPSPRRILSSIRSSGASAAKVSERTSVRSIPGAISRIRRPTASKLRNCDIERPRWVGSDYSITRGYRQLHLPFLTFARPAAISHRPGPLNVSPAQVWSAVARRASRLHWILKQKPSRS